MKWMNAAFAAGAMLLAGSDAIAQSPAQVQAANGGIVGILKPNGTFQPLLVSKPTANPEVATPTGTITLNLSISIASTLPAGATIHCALTIAVGGISANDKVDSVAESDQATANVSGSTATCQMVIPYQWKLFATSTNSVEQDTASLNYTITAVNASGDGRTSDVPFTSFIVPAAGVTKVYSASARI